MSQHHSTDASNQVSIAVVTLRDPMTGLPCQVLRPAYEHAKKHGRPIVITLYPDNIEPSTIKLSEMDEVIAEIITDNPGCLRADIEHIAASRYGTTIGTDGVKNRMRNDMPLRNLGYYVEHRRYYPPKA